MFEAGMIVASELAPAADRRNRERERERETNLAQLEIIASLCKIAAESSTLFFGCSSAENRT
jgi:hypothetical protein